MAGYIGLKPHMDVVVHHTTVSGDFALCRSQWRITGTDKDGKPIEVHHHAMEVMRRLPNGEWVFFIDHPWGADTSWAVDRPPTHGVTRAARLAALIAGGALWTTIMVTSESGLRRPPYYETRQN